MLAGKRNTSQLLWESLNPLLSSRPRWATSLPYLRSRCLLTLGSCRGMEALWLLLRHPMTGDGGRAAPRGASPSASSTSEEVEPPMMHLAQVEGTWKTRWWPITDLFSPFFRAFPRFSSVSYKVKQIIFSVLGKTRDLCWILLYYKQTNVRHVKQVLTTSCG